MPVAQTSVRWIHLMRYDFIIRFIIIYMYPVLILNSTINSFLCVFVVTLL